MGFLEFAHLATLQDQGLAMDRRQCAHDLEAVAGGLQHEQVLGRRVVLRPLGQAADGNFVEQFFRQRVGRGRSLEHSGGERIRVRVKANHPLGQC
jgi:hypothetical protein